jgi:hypothetical protein
MRGKANIFPIRKDNMTHCACGRGVKNRSSLTPNQIYMNAKKHLSANYKKQ